MSWPHRTTEHYLANKSSNNNNRYRIQQGLSSGCFSNPYEQILDDELLSNQSQCYSLATQPFSANYFCSACEKQCASLSAYNAHLLSHVKCHHPGCDFSASQKVVSAHYSQKHGKFSGSGFKSVTVAVPGLRPQKFNVCVGESKEDIDKWISDRKRNWPSRANIARKAEEARRRAREGGLPQNETDRERERIICEETRQSQGPIISEENVGSSAFSSLLSGYGSSSEESVENEKSQTMNEVHEEKEKSPPMKKVHEENISIVDGRKRKLCRHFMNGKCNRDNCPFLHDEGKRNEANEKKKRKKLANRKANESTLLRKLLERDIQQEASLTLQCIRFIVRDCNFFNAK